MNCKGKDKVKHSALVSDIEDRGLKILHFKSINDTKSTVAKKIASDQLSTWKIIQIEIKNAKGSTEDRMGLRLDIVLQQEVSASKARV